MNKNKTKLSYYLLKIKEDLFRLEDYKITFSIFHLLKTIQQYLCITF